MARRPKRAITQRRKSREVTVETAKGPKVERVRKVRQSNQEKRKSAELIESKEL